MKENEIATVMIAAAIEVHRTLAGPGLLEVVYEEALAFELESRGLTVTRQKTVPLMYKGRRLTSALRLHLLVNDLVTVECKATTATITCSKPRLSLACVCAISSSRS